MGKRELILIVVLMVAGAGVYQMTAPAPPPDAHGFTFGRLVQQVRAHLRGAPERRTVSRTSALELPADVDTLDLSDFQGTLTVTGSTRTDVVVHLEATLAGADAADLDAQEQNFLLELDTDGHTAAVRIDRDEMARRPRQILRVDVPERLKIRVGGEGDVEVLSVAALHLDGYRGDLRAESVADTVTGEYEDGRGEMSNIGAVTLNTGRVRLRLEAPASTTLESDNSTLEIIDASGPIILHQQGSRIDVRGTGGPVTVDGEGGVITLRDVAHPLNIDATRLTVRAEMIAAVPVDIAIEHDSVELSLPTQGVQLEASCEEGEVRAPRALEVTKADNRQTVSAAIAGGGPLVKVSVTRGDLTLRGRGL